MNRKLILMTCVGFLTAAPVFAAEEGKDDLGDGGAGLGLVGGAGGALGDGLGDGLGAGAPVTAVSLAQIAQDLRNMSLAAESIKPVLNKQNNAFLAAACKAADEFGKAFSGAIATDKRTLDPAAKTAAASFQGLVPDLLKPREEVYSILSTMVSDMVNDFKERARGVLDEDTTAFAKRVEELIDQAAEARLAARGK